MVSLANDKETLMMSQNDKFQTPLRFFYVPYSMNHITLHTCHRRYLVARLVLVMKRFLSSSCSQIPIFDLLGEPNTKESKQQNGFFSSIAKNRAKNGPNKKKLANLANVFLCSEEVPYTLQRQGLIDIGEKESTNSHQKRTSGKNDFVTIDKAWESIFIL